MKFETDDSKLCGVLKYSKETPQPELAHHIAKFNWF